MLVFIHSGDSDTRNREITLVSPKSLLHPHCSNKRPSGSNLAAASMIGSIWYLILYDDQMLRPQHVCETFFSFVNVALQIVCA